MASPKPQQEGRGGQAGQQAEAEHAGADHTETDDQNSGQEGKRPAEGIAGGAEDAGQDPGAEPAAVERLDREQVIGGESEIAKGKAGQTAAEAERKKQIHARPGKNRPGLAQVSAQVGAE